MKRVKLLPSILLLVLCVGILGMGIFAANPIKSNVTGTISVTAANSEVEITAYLNKVEEASKISDTFVTRKGATILLNNSALKFDAGSVNAAQDLHKKNIILQIKNNSQVKDLGAYFLTGTIGANGTQLTNIATNKQLDGKMGETLVEDVVSARFTHYTQIPKGETANITMELMLNNIYYEEINVPVNLSVNIEEYDPSLAIVSDGTAWHSGTEEPTNALGETYDFYLDTDDYNIYKKEESGWVLIANIKGDMANIEINESGYWVINGIVTEHMATTDNLENAIGDIFEMDNSVFEENYESYPGGFNKWDRTSSTFSGWGGSIGKPQTFNSLRWKVKARAAEITKIKVYLFEESYAGTILYEEELAVHVYPYEESEIQWNLPEIETNSKNINYYFAYGCDAYCDGMTNYRQDSIPETENRVYSSYFVNYATSYTSLQQTTDYVYFYIKAGMIVDEYRIKDSVVKDLLNNNYVTTFTNNNILLPNKIYGFAGQTIQLYFENIIAYELSDVHIMVDSGQKGNQYYNRWEYTPTGAETINLRISVFNRNFDLLCQKDINFTIISSTIETSAKVLVIGDSTVNAGHETQKMLDLAENDESFDITLLGTRGSGANLHEGRGGWTANSYLNSQTNSGISNAFYNPETSKFDLAYYMNANSYTDVDVVYIQLGINDIFGAKTNSALEEWTQTYISSMTEIINIIHRYDSNIKVIVNLIIPCQLDQDKFTTAYGVTQTVWRYKKNMYFANLALLKTFADTEGVYLSWYNASIDAHNNQGNDVHPKADGYYQLGTQMYYMLKAIS